MLVSQALGCASKESARVRALYFSGEAFKATKKESKMKKQKMLKCHWGVCVAMLTGLGTLFQAEAKTTDGQTPVAGNDDYYIEWIVPPPLPYPPVKKDDKWVSWAEAYGLTKPEPMAVRRPKNPKPVDPQMQWVEVKRRLAPWMTEEQLRESSPPKTPALEIAQRRATFKGGFVPKVDPAQLLAETKKQAAVQSKSAGFNGPMPMNAGIPTLHLAGIDFTGPSTTLYELWVTDAPTDQWFEIYFEDELNPNRWVLASSGPPLIGYGTSLQRYFLQVYGHPPQGFFRMFPLQDSDGDGLSDGMEIAVFKSDPNDPDSGFQRDDDGDGQPDLPSSGGNYIADGDEDFDGDQMSNLKELQMGINPLVAQNNLADTDSDGLPDWTENLIWIYQGIANPDLRDDSDGDGVDNYTEVAVLTDPSWPDAVYGYGNFASLPNSQRAFTLTPITIQHTASSTAASTEDLIYDNAGTLGTYMHLEVRRNQDAAGNYLTNSDTILFGGAFLTPPNGMAVDMLIDGVTPGDAYIPWGTLLTTSTRLLADIWNETKISDAIDQMNMQTIAVIQQRSMIRTIVRLRELQLTVDLTDASTGAQMRLRTAIGQIHTETTLFRETSAKIALYQGQNWATRAGFWVSGAGRVASYFSIPISSYYAWNTAVIYNRDVSRRYDMYADTAADLAVALGSLAQEFAPSFMIGNFWLVYWNQLIQFDGYDTF